MENYRTRQVFSHLYGWVPPGKFRKHFREDGVKLAILERRNRPALLLTLGFPDTPLAGQRMSSSAEDDLRLCLKNLQFFEKN